MADKVLLRADAVDHRLLFLAVGRGVDIREWPVGVGHQLAGPIIPATRYLGDSPSGTRGVHDDRDAGEAHRGADPVEVIGHDAVDSLAPKEKRMAKMPPRPGHTMAEVRRL